MKTPALALSVLACCALLSGCATKQALPPPQTDAQGTANMLHEKLYKGDSSALFLSLPPTYQANVRFLTSAAARAVDDDLWLAAVGVLDEIASTLYAQNKHLEAFLTEEPYLLPTQNTFRQVSARDLRRLGRSMRRFLEDLSRAELRNGQVENLLENEGFQEILAWTLKQGSDSGYRIEPFRKTSAVAPESLTSVTWVGENAVTNTVEWTQVEGRWIPRNMALAWPASSGLFLNKIDALPKTGKERLRLLAELWILRGQLRGLRHASSQTEFNARMFSFLQSIL